MHWVTTARYRQKYEIVIGFENGKSKLVDLANYLDKGILLELKDLNMFKRFSVNHDTDTIEWDNGADLSPDFLYEIGTSIDKSLVAA